MRAPHQNSPEHLAFLLELSIIHSLYGVIHLGMPLLFSTYGGYCVASLFNMVAFLVQEFSVSIIARFLHVGKTFAKEISRIYRYRNTVPPRLISHQLRTDGWLVKK